MMERGPKMVDRIKFRTLCRENGNRDKGTLTWNNGVLLDITRLGGRSGVDVLHRLAGGPAKAAAGAGEPADLLATLGRNLKQHHDIRMRTE
jgi:hypothetical protein